MSSPTAPDVPGPAAARAFTEPTGAPAWRRLPSWAVVATGDRTIGADLVRSMAVTEVILPALESVRTSADLPAPRRPEEAKARQTGATS